MTPRRVSRAVLCLTLLAAPYARGAFIDTSGTPGVDAGSPGGTGGAGGDASAVANAPLEQNHASATFKLLIGHPAGPKCAACPLPCEAGANGSCN
jgi:hypothetical protein